MSRLPIICVLFVTLFHSTFAQNPPFTVTRPDPGDTLVLSTYDGANEIFINWDVAAGTQDSPVYIALQRGDDVDSLETIENVNGSAPNNGSYTWDGRDSISLASGQDPWLARTACNYTVRLLVDGLVAYSQYFTIINEEDGPVPDDATCPIERGIARPQFAEKATNSSTIHHGEALSGGASGNNGGNGGISTSTLAIAIVVPIVVLLIVFGLLLWFGIRRGWFVKLADKRNNNGHLTHENTAGLAQNQPMSPATFEEKKAEPAPAYAAPLRELHSDHRAWEAEGTQVYQLEGDERDARFGDANIRGS